jgi:hypothetical protein
MEGLLGAIVACRRGLDSYLNVYDGDTVDVV